MILFVVLSGYQIVFMLAKLMNKKKEFKAKKNCRYGVVIAARNESAVIAYLIDSINRQDYPKELVDIFVVADNCTDNTAEIARAAGATVYERFNDNFIGKGYALEFLFEHISKDFDCMSYDGFFVFDADNLLDENYITEMNKVFSNGFAAVTSYRNTKNYGDNWISAGYGLWFLRESEYLNRPRAFFNTSSILSGTGYVFKSSYLEKNNGWKYFKLAEDWEFTADIIANGEKVGYCSTAVYYDEQPTKFSASITQRSRWIKGSIQVFSEYGGKVMKGFLKTGSFSNYDLMMGIIPTVVLAAATLILNGSMAVAIFTTARQELPEFIFYLLFSLLFGYLGLFLTGFLTLLTEWKHIRCSGPKKIFYSLSYPFFVLSFMVAMIPAVFGKVTWKPIDHKASMSISDMSKQR